MLEIIMTLQPYSSLSTNPGIAERLKRIKHTTLRMREDWLTVMLAHYSALQTHVLYMYIG
jgi:hypothetical protein